MEPTEIGFLVMFLIASARAIWSEHKLRKANAELLKMSLRLAGQLSTSHRLRGELGYAQRTPMPNSGSIIDAKFAPSSPSRLYHFIRTRKLTPP